MLVIIPSNREIRLEFVEPLIAAGARFIIVDDSEGSIRIDHPQFEVWHWGRAEYRFGKEALLLPRRNGACRDLGFAIAYLEHAPDEIIIALDDDCQVESDSFLQDVEQALSAHPRPMATSPDRHLNILDLYENIEPGVYPRGFPYSERLRGAALDWIEWDDSAPMFNLGLWQGAFDVNAIDKLQGPQWQYPDARLRFPHTIIPRGALVSVCSMNMHFRNELVPAAYQLPMHVPVGDHWVIDRYGDIWGGFLLKTLMDIKGDWMSAGAPMISHRKEGSFHRNIWQEHMCHLLNDEFLRFIQTVREEVNVDSYLGMMSQVPPLIARTSFSAGLGPYMSHLHTSLTAWLKILGVREG